jgi:hypothetical protein
MEAEGIVAPADETATRVREFQEGHGGRIKRKDVKRKAAPMFYVFTF